LRRWLVLNETTALAWCPDWYSLMQAAKYLGVAPWDLMARSVWWRDKAVIAASAEAQADDIKNKQT